MSIPAEMSCPYCNERVPVTDGRLSPHTDIYPLRWCEGGNLRVVRGLRTRMMHDTTTWRVALRGEVQP